MSYLFVDCETKSFADLKTCGAWRYSEDPTTDCISIAWAVDKKAVFSSPPKGAFAYFYNKPTKDLVFVARNALFDFAIMKNVLIPKYGFHPDFGDPSRWLCTAALSRMHGLPASLADSAEYLNKTHKKLADGMRLIQMYSIPAKNKKTGERTFRPIPPDEMKRWLEYDKADVEADREAFYTMIKLPNFELEKEIFQHDFALNIKGVRIDTKGLAHLVEVVEAATDRAMKDQTKYTVTWRNKKGEENTGPLNVRSGPKLTAWLASKGFDAPNNRVETLEKIYDELDADELSVAGIKEVRDVLSFRFFLAKASIKKYRAAANRVSPDGRLRYFIKYFGAHTGRYASEGFQIHNLPKSKWKTDVEPDIEIGKLIKEINADMPYKQIVELGKQILPGLIIPDKGNAFLSGDFAAVEARGIAWLSGCTKMLNEFMTDDRIGDKTKDLYSRTGKKIAGEKGSRQLGKVFILAPVYGMGAKKARTTAAKWGVAIPLQIAEKGIQNLRQTYPEIVKFWYDLEDALRSCWLSKQPRTVGKIRFERGGNYVKVRLPSGRWLFYHQIRIEDGQISYMNFGKKGARVKIWGGSLAENITQAVCRDILTDRMMECEKNKLPVVMHVHDEDVSEIKKASAKKDKILFDKIMNTAPEWAKGFPLKTESEISIRYHK
jgi:DNA polymerase bacteriophage-type